jgi:hypothetical protein
MICCSLWVIKICNYLDENCKPLVYFIPEYFLTFAFEVLRIQSRLSILELDYLWRIEPMPMLGKLCESLFVESTKFIVNHMNDPNMPNPDLQDQIQSHLNLILQEHKYRDLLEKSPAMLNKLVPNMLTHFGKFNMNAMCKNYLRMFRYNTFNDIIYATLPEYQSTIFRQSFNTIISTNSNTAFDFMLSTIENLHLIYSSIQAKIDIVSLGNIPNEEKAKAITEIKKSIGIYYDILRIIESSVNIVPSAFIISKATVFQQLSNLCMTIIRSCCDGLLSFIFAKINSNAIQSKYVTQSISKKLHYICYPQSAASIYQ